MGEVHKSCLWVRAPGVVDDVGVMDKLVGVGALAVTIVLNS